jgi:hypothetical protein
MLRCEIKFSVRVPKEVRPLIREEVRPIKSEIAIYDFAKYINCDEGTQDQYIKTILFILRTIDTEGGRL